MLTRGAVVFPSVLGLCGTAIAFFVMCDDDRAMEKYGTRLKVALALSILGIILFIVLPDSDTFEALLKMS